MATLDEGVINLQRFVATLANATSVAGHVDDHLQAKASTFAELEDVAADEGGGLNDQLERGVQAVDTGENEATAALGELARSATEGRETLVSAQARVEQTASDLEQKVRDARADLDQAHTSLTEQGFQELGRALDEAEQELSSEAQEADQAFAALESAIVRSETESEAAWNGAQDELDETTSELAQGGSALETEATDGVHAFQAAGAELETHCADLVGDIDVIYDALGSSVEAQGQHWEQTVQGAAQQSLDFLQDGGHQRMEQPAAMLQDDALAGLEQEYACLASLLDGATATAAELQGLAEELAKCQSVVQQVDELMNALTE